MTGYIRPATAAEAARARSDHPDWEVLCGGTDLLVAAHKRDAPPGIIDVFGCPELVGVREVPRKTSEDSGDRGAIVIGAATTYAHILASALCRRALPALVAASREIGALQIQARGTIGGNIATSSPVGDSLPVLLALDAHIEVLSVSGSRTLPYETFCAGYRQTALAPDEIITAVRIPTPDPDALQMWRKVGPRRAQSISKVMMAAVGRVHDGHVAHARIGLGAVADRPIRARAVEAALIGQTPGAWLADEARRALASEIEPIDDVRSTAQYRLAVAQNLVARFALALAAK